MRDIACNQPDAGASNLADCVRLQGISLNCPATPTAADFGSCVSDIRALSCGSLFDAASGSVNIPNACAAPLQMIPESAAAKKCDDFAEKICEWDAKCQNIVATVAELQSCQLDISGSIGCSFATGVGATYDQCLIDVGTVPCPSDGGADAGASDGGTGPATCNTAITFAN